MLNHFCVLLFRLHDAASPRRRHGYVIGTGMPTATRLVAITILAELSIPATTKLRMQNRSGGSKPRRSGGLRQSSSIRGSHVGRCSRATPVVGDSTELLYITSGCTYRTQRLLSIMTRHRPSPFATSGFYFSILPEPGSPVANNPFCCFRSSRSRRSRSRTPRRSSPGRFLSRLSASRITAHAASRLRSWRS